MSEGWSRPGSEDRPADDAAARPASPAADAPEGSAADPFGASPGSTGVEPAARPDAEEEARREAGYDGTTIADGQPRMLAPEFVTVERITGAITTGAIAAGAGVGVVIAGLAVGRWWLFGVFAGGWLAVFGFLLWWSYRYPSLFYARAQYTLEPKGIEIRRGVWWRSVIDVPRSRVQHTDVSQGPLMRRYGIARLVIHTAGTENASVDLNGLDQPTALRIRDFLIRGGESDGP